MTVARPIRAALLAGLCLGVAAPTPVWADDEAPEAGSTRDLYLLLIRQARADGRPRAALAYLADFERRYPAEVEARIIEINCLLDLGRIEAAEAAVRQLPESDPAGDLHTIRGHVLAARGAWVPAIAQYRAALVASPANPLVRNALGYAQLRAGRTAEAVETLKAAADLAPANEVIRNNLLLALTVAGRGDEADAIIGTMPEGAGGSLRRQLAYQARRLAVVDVPSAEGEPR